MRLRPHRRTPVVWSSAVAPADPPAGAAFTRPALSRRLRRLIRTGALLTAIGLIRLGGAARPRWRPLLAGGVLTTAGLVMRSGPGSMVLIPGMLFLVAALLVPPDPGAARTQRRELERELATYCTPAQRRDLEAVLDQYPDGVSSELRDILARQAAVRDGRGRSAS